MTWLLFCLIHLLKTACAYVQSKSQLAALEAKNSKLEYQILHLKRAVKNVDTALKAGGHTGHQ